MIAPTPFDLGPSANVNLLMQPLQQGLQSYRQGMDKQFEGERALKKEQLAERADTRQQQAFDLEQQKAKVQQIAGIAQAALAEQDPARRAQLMQSAYAVHPEMVTHLQRAGQNPNDHGKVAQFLIAEARGYVDPLADEAKRANIEQSRAATAVSRANLTQLAKATPEYRASVAGQYGLQRGSPEWNAFVINGTYSPKDDFIHLKDGEEIQRKVVGPDGRPTLEKVASNEKSKVPPGYRPTADNNLEAIPGGPADIKQNEKRQQDYASATQVIQQLDELAKSVNRVATAPGLAKNFGPAGYIPNMPGGEAANAAALLDTLKTQGAFAALQEMRNASKSGGALGAISDREGQMLQNAMAPLGKAQSAKQVQESLKTILDHIETSKQRIRDAYNDHWNRNGEAAKREMGAPTGPARIRDDSDYNRLPSGSRFMDPEGNVRIKP